MDIAASAGITATVLALTSAVGPGDTLFRETPGQLVAFVPISETRFRLGPVLTAEFVIDPAGGVTQVMGSGSQQMKARRTHQ